MANIRHIRLVNGDEIIGDFISSFIKNKKEYIRLNQPLIVQRADEENIFLITYAPFSKDKEIDFDACHIINVSDVHEEVERYYHNSIICNKKFADIDLIKKIKMTNDEIEFQLTSMKNTSVVTDMKSPSKRLH